MPGKVPAQKLADYYITFSSPESYKDLIIKKDSLTNNLKSLINDNIFNIVSLSQQLENKNKIENVKNYIIAWAHDVPLLTNSKPIKIKSSFLVSDFLNYKFQGDNTQRTEKNYIEQFNAIINNIAPEYKGENKLNFFLNNHLEIFYKCLKYRNDKKQSLDSFKNDLKLIVKFLKLMLGNKNELYIKYSVLLSSLSRIIEYKEKFNKNESTKEIKTAIKYDDLLKLQNTKEKEFNNFYLDLPINKLKNNKELRTKNIKLLLLSFYVCFPPLRRELFECKIINNEKDKNTYDNTIYIKDKNNIFLYLNTIKKKHEPITININDPVIKSFSGVLVDILINLIIESVQTFPREFLFINSKGDKASADTLNDYNKSFVPDLQLNINSFRSAYISYWLPKLNKIQKDRVVAFMRTSASMTELNYFKQFETEGKEEINIINSNETEQETEPEPEIKVKTRAKRITDEQRKQKREKKNNYLKTYYEDNKDKILEKAKENSRTTYGRRIVRELNNNVKDISTVKEETLNKWGIKYNSKTKLYYIED